MFKAIATDWLKILILLLLSNFLGILGKVKKLELLFEELKLLFGRQFEVTPLSFLLHSSLD